MLNNICINGRLTRDPEYRTTTNGTAVTTFTVAVDRPKNKNGEKETDFIPVVAWRGLAEICGNYFHKGNLVSIQGRLQIRTYEANDGSKRTVAEIMADKAENLSPKGETQGNNISPSFTPNFDELEEEITAPDELPF
jgi:single-strand DNA-binding protein